MEKYYIQLNNVRGIFIVEQDKIWGYTCDCPDMRLIIGSPKKKVVMVQQKQKNHFLQYNLLWENLDQTLFCPEEEVTLKIKELKDKHPSYLEIYRKAKALYKEFPEGDLVGLTRLLREDLGWTV